MGVGQLVADNDQRGFSAAGGFFQNVVNGIVFVGGSQSNHTLVGPGEGHGVQLPAVYRHNDGTGLLGLGGQTLQTFVRIAGGDEKLVNGPPAFQGFGDGIAAFQLALGFLCGLLGFASLRAAISAVISIIHIGSSPVTVHKCLKQYSVL